MTELSETFTRYATLIASLLDSPTASSFDVETATAVQVERGAPQGRFDRLLEVSRSGRLDQINVIDAAGHQRTVYRPLLIYAWLSAYRRDYETLPRDEFGRWDESLRAWSDLLESDLPSLDPAAAAWTALALHVAGKVLIRDAWTDLSADTFGRLARGQTDGAFLTATASENPEPLWYDELAIFHAASSYAVQAEDRTIARAVAASAAHLFQNVQPDHASGQPWGVFGFIWNDTTRPMADSLLHAVQLRRPIDGVSLILLADALYCLRLFL